MAKFELPSWFLDTNAQGQELGFDKTRQDGKTGNRLFKNGHYPDEEVFTKLFASQTFKIKVEDQAKDSSRNIQISDLGDSTLVSGLVTLSTNDEAKAFESGNIALESRVSRTNQLPETVDGQQQSITIDDDLFDGIIVNTADTSTEADTRLKYQSSINPDFLTYLKTLIEKATDPLGTVKAYHGTEQDLQNSGKPWLIADGKTLGQTGSGADYEGDIYFNLFILLFTSKFNVSEQIANSAWSVNATVGLPDTRGKFVRGFGTITGSDGITYNSAGLGEEQLSNLPNHNHDLNTEPTALVQEVSLSGISVQGLPANTETGSVINVTDEVRPINITLNYIIKY